MTETETNTGNDETVTSTTETQAEAKTFTQEEVNDLMAKAKGNLENRFAKKYEGVDLDEYAQLKEEKEKANRKEQLKKGEYEKIIEEQASKHNAEKAQWQQEKTEYKINTPVLNAAAKHKAVDPDQVRSLLKGEFRLGESGEVEVLDSEGKARFNDDGKLLSVDDRVREFLDSNAHFVQATPSTTNSNSNHSVNIQGELDVAKLDMKNPEDREKYKEYRKKRGIA